MQIGVLALQGDVAEHTAALRRLGVDVRTVRLPADLAGLDGIVVPGGESTTMSMLLESSGLLEPLGAALRAGLPVLGTCAGLILLAADVIDGRADQRALGVVDLAVRRNGYGRQLQSFECQVAVDGIEGGPVHAVFIRAPRIEAVGPAVAVLGRLPDGAGGAMSRRVASAPAPGGDPGTGPGTPVLCRQRSALVAAFHPELTGDDRVHRLFLDMVAGIDHDGSGQVARRGRTGDAAAGGGAEPGRAGVAGDDPGRPSTAAGVHALASGAGQP